MGTAPVDVAAGDLDGDGDVDLVTSNLGPGPEDVSILLNNGAGGFGPAAFVALPGGATPRSVVVIDVDGALAPDVAVTDDSSNQVHVLLNNGTAQFAAPAAYPTGNIPFDLAAADIDGDSLPDLVTLNSNSLSVLLNTGGAFDLPIGTGFVQTANEGNLAVGNIDATLDTDLDVVLRDDLHNLVQVLTNDGAGDLSVLDTITPVGDGPVALGDVNADGSADLVKAELGAFPAGDVTVRPSDGSGTLGAPASFGPVGFMRGLVFDDLDGDTDRDVAGTAATTVPGHVVVLANTGGGALGAPSVFGVPAFPWPWPPATSTTTATSTW